MPTYSDIVITFDDDFILGNGLRLITTLNNSAYLDNIWLWVTTRTGADEVTLGTDTATPGERACINFKTAFDLDFPIAEKDGYDELEKGNTHSGSWMSV